MYNSTTNRKRWHVALVLALLPGALLAQPSSAMKPVAEAGARFGRFSAPARFAYVLTRIETSRAPVLVGKKKWASLVAKHTDAINRTTTHAAFAAAVNDLFKDGGVSHFHYFMEDEWAYWHLLGAFKRDGRDVTVEHVGLYTQRIDEKWFVRALVEGTPAADSKIRTGDEVVSVAGEPFVPIVSWRGKAGKPVKVTLRRRPGETYSIMLEPVRDSLYSQVEKAMIESTHIIEHDGLRMAYTHGWMMLGDSPVYKLLLQLQPHVDGLLLDYRDGVGGSPYPAMQFLVGPAGQWALDGGQGSWKKPVVTLIADGTRSAKELVVYAARKAGITTLVGTPTPGAVTAVGGIVDIGEDAMLLLPGFKFELEGKPTLPDHHIERDLPYCGGADPQLDLAKELLAKRIRKANAAREPEAATVGAD